MSTSLDGTGPQGFLLRPEYSSVPGRSPETSIILAEAVLRGQQARKSRCISRAAAFFRPWLEFVRQTDAGLGQSLHDFYPGWTTGLSMAAE